MMPREDIRILVAMVDEGLRSRLLSILQKMDVRSVSSNNLDQAINLSMEANLVVTGCSGFVRTIRSQKIDVPAVVINGTSKKEAKELRLAGVISKNASTREIIETLQQYARMTRNIMEISEQKSVLKSLVQSLQ